MIDLRRDAPETTPDVYFSRAYGELDATFRGGEWRTATDEHGDWQLPLVLTGEPGLVEARSPYGYAGIHIASSWDPADAVQCWRETQSRLQDIGAVSCFLRFSPLDPGSSSTAATFPGLTVTRSGETYINAIDEPDVMWSQLEGRARTAVRKARTAGLSAEVRYAQSGELGPDASFRRLYESTMRRVDAAPEYFFDDDYFDALATMPLSPLHVVEVRQADETIAAALVLRHGERAHYHLSGSDPAAARLGANALLVWTMLEWCAESGVSFLQLGGGIKPGDGLALFKRSFGGELAPFYTGGAVIDRAEYDRLTVERAKSVKRSVADLEASGYFPAFRAGS